MISSLVRAYREDDLFSLTGGSVNPYLVRRFSRNHSRNGHGNHSHLYQASITNTELERPMKVTPDSRVVRLTQSTPDIAVT